MTKVITARNLPHPDKQVAPARRSRANGQTSPGIVAAPSLTCPRCQLLSATRRPVRMPAGHYWDVCPTCEAEVAALPKETARRSFEGVVIQAILRQYAWEAARLLGPGPLAAVLPVPQHEDEVARQRIKRRSKRNGHGNLRKRNRAKAA